MEDFEKIMSLDPASVVEYCTNPNTPPNMALSKLMDIISTAGKLFEELTDDQMREVLLKLQTIGRGLRHNTCENNAMRYFYFGEFATRIEDGGNMFGKYKVAHLLGITREHEPQFREVERELTKQGYICFAPAIYIFDVYLQHEEMLNDMCYEKLKVCDLCVLVTPEHVGKSTTMRIQQAKDIGIPVYTFNEGELMPY